MPIITFPGVRSIDRPDLLINPNLEEGDITISIGGEVDDLPFELVEEGRSPIAITLTEEQATSNGVISIRDQSDPPEWIGPYDEAGPFNGSGAAGSGTVDQTEVVSLLRKMPRATEELEDGEYSHGLEFPDPANASQANVTIGPRI